jgi:hypothetical protein
MFILHPRNILRVRFLKSFLHAARDVVGLAEVIFVKRIGNLSELLTVNVCKAWRVAASLAM